MRGQRFGRIVGSALVATVLVGGVSLADTTVGTGLTIARTPTGTVDPGTVVNFHGYLTSPENKCVKRMKVKLIRIGQGVVGRDTTNRSGKYSIDKAVSSTGRYRTRFAGAVVGTHPRTIVCEASASNAIKVRVA